MSILKHLETVFNSSSDAEEFLVSGDLVLLKKTFYARSRMVHPDSISGSHSDFLSLSREYDSLRSLSREERLRHFSKKRIVTRPPLRKASGIRPYTYQSLGVEVYSQVDLPTKHLCFGMFLYYTQRISFQMLGTALAWQREKRPSIGRLAVAWKFLEEDDVDWIASATRISGPFGARAHKMGYLTESQLRFLLRHQISLQPPLGEFFILHGIFTRTQVNTFLRELMLHNAKYT